MWVEIAVLKQFTTSFVATFNDGADTRTENLVLLKGNFYSETIFDLFVCTAVCTSKKAMQRKGCQLFLAGTLQQSTVGPLSILKTDREDTRRELQVKGRALSKNKGEMVLLLQAAALVCERF